MFRKHQRRSVAACRKSAANYDDEVLGSILKALESRGVSLVVSWEQGDAGDPALDTARDPDWVSFGHADPKRPLTAHEKVLISRAFKLMGVSAENETRTDYFVNRGRL